MSDDRPSPAVLAAEIAAARDRLVATLAGVPDDRWCAPLNAGDPRPVCVVGDHVADAYGYLSDFIEILAEGGHVQVSSEIIDDLNERHFEANPDVTRVEVVAHLQEGSERIMSIVSGLKSGVVYGGDGRIARLAGVAAQHADNHRAEIEAAL